MSARTLAVALVAALLCSVVVTSSPQPQAAARSLDDIRDELSRTQEERAGLQERIEAAVVEHEALESRIGEVEQEQTVLLADLEQIRAELDEVSELVITRVRETFKHGSALDPLVVFLASDDPESGLARAQAVSRSVAADHARGEALAASRARFAAAEQRVADAAEELDRARRRLAEVTQGLRADMQRLQQLEAELTSEERAELERLEQERLERERREREERERRERQERERREREEREQREERERQAAEARQREEADARQREQAEARQREQAEARERASGTDEPDPAPRSQPASSGSSGGSMVCPLDQPRSFVDSWGAPRSGGRAHRGTDIMGPRGIPVRAITSGVWDIRPYGASAGNWGVLRGDDGSHYWYLHLDRHTASNGRVSAGQQIGTNGSTGNAVAGAEHVHFEKHPGGGAAVNPYPLLRQVCG